ncbi:tail fiber protein [Mucilaginibacter sp.]|uniref:phage tail protein n=1 Tax=Mucilaginibacter sp. TaxID=1882438 RepID=UPI0025CF1B56|nr:tail fiber protein [Mucilaginibacter sp.]
MEPYIGEIKMFAGNFNPRGWALCNGQLMSIAQNSALFAILGTTYGGDGVQTFGLPDYRGRAPMHWGSGPGLTPRVIGEAAGEENVTLLNSNMPIHNHLINASTAQGTVGPPTNGFLATSVDNDSGGNPFNFVTTTPDTTLAPTAVAAAGGSIPHDNMQPYLVVTFIIATEGIFPSRN